MKAVCDNKIQLVAELLDIYSMRYLSKVCINSLPPYVYNMRDFFKYVMILSHTKLQHTRPLLGLDLSLTLHTS